MSVAAKIAIVGGGLTGLTAAWRLRSAGHSVRVFEKSDRAGGRALSVRKDGFVFDTGAITMLPTYNHTRALIEELGITGHLSRVVPVIGIPRGGRVHRIDLAHPLRSVLTTQLVSTRTKLRALNLIPPMMRAWKFANYQTLSTLAEWDGETVGDFSRRELGEEFLEYIAGPIIRGNTLNSCESAPAGELLWMLRQYAAPYLFSFDQGINFLSETLAAKLDVAFDSEIISVVEASDGVTINGFSSEGKFSEAFDACVLALPPPELLPLATKLSIRQRKFLESITPLPSVNFHVGLRHVPPPTETFILPPQSEDPLLTTIVMDHLKAPGRAPAGKGVVSFFLSDTWSAKNVDRDDDELLAEVLTMAKPFIGDVAPDVESYVVQRWPYAIIKSEVGLYRRIRDFEADISLADRIQIGGDFLSMGMEAAVSSGTTAANRLHASLSGCAIRKPLSL